MSTGAPIQQIRGALCRTLHHKCHFAGVHLVRQYPAGTAHTCPKCVKPTHTYASPTLDAHKLDAYPRLCCVVCGWNGARDYAAAINIALLGVAFLKQALHAYPSPRDDRPTMTEKALNSESYSGSWLALRLPPTSRRCRLLHAGKLHANGWIQTVALWIAIVGIQIDQPSPAS